MKIEHPLTFEVQPKRRSAGDDVDLLGASVKVSGAMAIDHDLQPGTVLMVRVCNADGQLVAQCEAEVTGVGFRQVKHRGVVIGMERVHTSKVDG